MRNATIRQSIAPKVRSRTLRQTLNGLCIRNDATRYRGKSESSTDKQETASNATGWETIRELAIVQDQDTFKMSMVPLVRFGLA